MAFTIERPGGFFDIPDGALAAGDVAMEDVLVALNSLIRFAATCDEYFTTHQMVDGDAVGLPQSPDDGYAYGRSECLYAFAMNYSPNVKTGVNGGNGDLLYTYSYVEQDTGKVDCGINYYVQGGQDANSNDGGVVALICARRGGGSRTAATGTPGGGSGGTGGGPAGGGGNPHSGGHYPYGPLGDQGGQGDPRSLGGGRFVNIS